LEDFQQAQKWADEQLKTNWVKEFDDLLRQVHPLHPGHLGKLPVKYNWTVHQSEWATDVSFRTREELEQWYPRWVRYAFENFTSTKVLRFLGKSGRLSINSTLDVHSDVEDFEESVRLKHWVNGNSAKAYDHSNIFRVETTINNPKEFRSYRAKMGEPDGAKSWRIMQRGVADTYRRAEVSQACNNRYLEALASVAATTTVAELISPWCERVLEPGDNGRKMRALNPLSSDDAALLTAVSDPRWQLNGLRNHDVAEALYGEAPVDPIERKRRSAKVSRLLRLLRAHGILKKVPTTNRYLVCSKSRDALLALLAARNANPEKLTTNAA
jgi:hypothetical protein